MTIKCWIHGYSGRMGSEIRHLMSQAPHIWQLIGGSAQEILADAQSQEQWDNWQKLPLFLNKSDLIIDFSAAEANKELKQVLLKHPEITGKAFLLGTTGLGISELDSWKALAKDKQFKLLIAPNTSLGVLLTLKVSQLLAQVLSPLGFDIELIETHHRNKIDAPSGTAKFLADGICQKIDKLSVYGRQGKRQSNEVGLASLRGGSVFGEHEIKFLGDNEELTVSHRALNRTLFAQGALHLSMWLVQQDFGVYRLEDISIEEMVALLRKPGNPN